VRYTTYTVANEVPREGYFVFEVLHTLWL
jgi:hypothetical protein